MDRNNTDMEQKTVPRLLSKEGKEQESLKRSKQTSTTQFFGVVNFMEEVNFFEQGPQ